MTSASTYLDKSKILLHSKRNKKKKSDWSNLKVFADDELDVAQKKENVCKRIENIVAKGESAAYQPFFLLPHTYPFFSGSLIVGVV